MPLDYPLWLRAAHFFNFLLLSLLIRSGLEILSAHPRLYWNDHCTPGSEWLKFTRKQRPGDRLWTSWQIVPDAWHAMLSYLSFHVVETPRGYNALQQLSYAAVIFLLAPFSMATGVAMSPAVAARFPWYIKIFHGRQSARSLHFLLFAPSSYSS
jgi:thiosulfate reductase cytochrome b subunit